MEIKNIIKELREDNKSDLKQLNLSKKEYQKLYENWLNKETEEFELISTIELRKQIIKKLNNFQKS